MQSFTYRRVHLMYFVTKYTYIILYCCYYIIHFLHNVFILIKTNNNYVEFWYLSLGYFNRNDCYSKMNGPYLKLYAWISFGAHSEIFLEVYKSESCCVKLEWHYHSGHLINKSYRSCQNVISSGRQKLNGRLKQYYLFDLLPVV